MSENSPSTLPTGSTAPTVTLTRPPLLIGRLRFSSLIVAPLSLAYLAGSLRKNGHQIAIVDPVGEDPFEVNPVPGRDLVTHGWSLEKTVAAIPDSSEVIGVSCMFSQEWPIARKLIELIRERFSAALIVVGGEHITALAEFSLRDCDPIDYAVVGEGEETLVELIETLKTGGDPSRVDGIAYLEDSRLVQTKPRQRIKAVDDIPRPAWDLAPLETYLRNRFNQGISKGRTIPMIATRGCPYSCTFCSVPTMWGNRWVARNPKSVVAEIETYIEEYAADNFDFQDLTAVIKKDWIVDFCNELIDRRLDITWQLPSGTRTEAIDDEVTKLLAQSGHRNLVYAPESGSPRVLKIIKKKVKLPRMLESMRSAVRHSISVKLNLILGLPMETRRDILATYWLLVRSAWIGVDDATCSTFSPYPGSALFEQLRESGRIGNLDDDYFFGLTFEGKTFGLESYCEKVGSKELVLYRLFGMILFYSLSHLFRPTRIIQTIRNVYRDQHKTRLEKALGGMVLNLRRRKRLSV